MKYLYIINKFTLNIMNDKSKMKLIIKANNTALKDYFDNGLFACACNLH